MILESFESKPFSNKLQPSKFICLKLFFNFLKYSRQINFSGRLCICDLPQTFSFCNTNAQFESNQCESACEPGTVGCFPTHVHAPLFEKAGRVPASEPGSRQTGPFRLFEVWVAHSHNMWSFQIRKRVFCITWHALLRFMRALLLLWRALLRSIN